MMDMMNGYPLPNEKVLYSTTLKVTDDIVEMMSSGYISYVKNMRKSFIQFNKLEIPEFKNELIQVVIKEYIVPFVSDAFDHLTAFSLVPYVFVDREITYDKISRTMKVPIVLPLGTYSITTVLYKDFKKEYIVTMKTDKPGDRTGDKHKIHVIASSNRKGPSVNDSKMVDSDCGVLYPDWKKFKIREAEVDALYKKSIAQPIILQRIIGSATTQANLESYKYDMHLNRKHDQGFEEDEVPDIYENKESGIVILPNHFETARYQPALAYELMDISKHAHYFYSSVDLAFKMPIQSTKEDASYAHSRSRSGADEAKAQIATALDEVRNDLTHVVYTVIMQMFEDENPEMTIYLPHKALVDFENVYFLHNEGVIDDNVAREEYINVVGIHSSRATTGPLERREDVPQTRVHENKERKKTRFK